jgi:hypothetical protein
MVKIYDKPDRDAPILGGFRAGQSLVVTDAVLTPERQRRMVYGCTQGWYPVEPRGWVCVGGAHHATRDPTDPRVMAAMATAPDSSSDYPYRYGTSIGAPQYLRIPTAAEQRQAEPGLDEHLQSLPAADETRGGAIDGSPAGRPPPEAVSAYFAGRQSALTGSEAYDGMKLAWTREFDAQGRSWLLTADLTLVPKDKVRIAPLPTLRGIDLRASSQKLPLAFFWLDDTFKFRMGDDGKLYRTEDRWKRHEFVEANWSQAMGPGGIYWQTRNGQDYVRFQDVTMLRASPRPPDVGPRDKWIEVRITWGYLIAYEGDEPVYATAISPGVDGINQREHATARGKHFIDWKMSSADMSGRDKGKDWFVDEVPWVAFYKDNYAVHGAFWHDDFGRPKSHGCINVPAADMRHLFAWMDPVMPAGWSAVSVHHPYNKATFLWVRN